MAAHEEVDCFVYHAHLVDLAHLGGLTQSVLQQIGVLAQFLIAVPRDAPGLALALAPEDSGQIIQVTHDHAGPDVGMSQSRPDVVVLPATHLPLQPIDGIARLNPEVDQTNAQQAGVLAVFNDALLLQAQKRRAPQSLHQPRINRHRMNQDAGVAVVPQGRGPLGPFLPQLGCDHLGPAIQLKIRDGRAAQGEQDRDRVPEILVQAGAQRPAFGGGQVVHRGQFVVQVLPD